MEKLRDSSYITREGVNLLGISECAENIGLRTMPVKVPLKKLVKDAPLPCILHWNQNHFVTLYKIKNGVFHIADPGRGKLNLSKNDFQKCWQDQSNEGIALLIEPTENFYNKGSEYIDNNGFQFIFRYLKPYKKYIFQLFLSMLAGSGLALLFPFFTQALVDKGINRQNLGIIHLVLISQLVLFVGSTAIEMIRSWLMLHMNSRINLTILSDFLMKLMRLPLQYFDTKLIGDIKQRIADHNRIQSFLTGSALSTIFSVINLIVFTIVLAVYSIKILFVFLLFSVLGISWILLFLHKRKQLDYVRFQRMSDNENILFELVTGMQEIKLNNCERPKRWRWEKLQAKLFHLNIKSLALGQYQETGSLFFNQLKNIIISYIAATEVMGGNMTLGMMMSVSYIIGQLNSPVQSILGFIQAAQDAKISLDRLGEIHNKPDEETENNSTVLLEGREQLSHHHRDSIELNNVSYQYSGPNSPLVLKNINISIPKGKVTAIVGTSGSGKTTLMKLLLQFYKPVQGNITVNGINLNNISPTWWRNECGVVMQEGYIFNDNIANNISVSDETTDHAKLEHAVKIANIGDFISELPMGFLSNIGNTGNGISTGQKQRILIARAVYKSPKYLFFDEATSALDANNERVIHDNLGNFFKGKTVVVIAHRLSTVKNADQILVMEHGEIVEVGNHGSLIEKKGKYFELVKNQLDLAE